MLYVSFDDSTNDPTYTSADFVMLVESEDEDGENPCVADGAKSTPLIPMTVAEARVFADMMGWTVSMNGDGNVVFTTSIK